MNLSIQGIIIILNWRLFKGKYFIPFTSNTKMCCVCVANLQIIVLPHNICNSRRVGITVIPSRPQSNPAGIQL